MGQHTPARQRQSWKLAEQVRAAHADAVNTINARRDLSVEGRRRQLAAVTAKVRDRLAELRQADAAEVLARQDHLIGELFRPPRTGRDTEAERDAASRCASITQPGEALRMLQTARDLDDHGLARACARRAAACYDESPRGPEAPQWRQVLDTWCGSGLAPTYASHYVAELIDIESESLDGMASMAMSQHYRADVPDGVTPGQLDRLAAAADDVGDQRPLSQGEQRGLQWAADHRRYVRSEPAG